MMVTTMIRRCALPMLLFGVVVIVGCSSATPVTTTAPGPQAGGVSSSVPDGAPEGTATVDGAVQRISIDLSKGFYDPSIVNAKADVPLEITFGQGQGCLASVLVPDFGVDQDLTAGPVVVKLPAMKAGEYSFSCGMQMVFGKIVVR